MSMPCHKARDKILPLKMEALIPAMKSPPAMTITPIPKDPRGSLGEPPPPAPLCLIISRILDIVNTTCINGEILVHGVTTSGHCVVLWRRGGLKEKENSKTR